MKHIFHLVWFDLKATRNLTVVWGFVLAVQAVLLAVGPNRIAADSLSDSVGWDFGMLAVRMGVAIAIAAVLIQRDPLVGTTAFWRTRPASRFALMTSKLVTMLLVLVLLPALVMGLLLLSLGLMPADALAGAMSLAAEQILTLGLILPLAVVTANLAHFAIAAAGTWAVTMLMFSAVLPLLEGRWPALFVNLGAWGMPLAGALPVGVVLVILNQYLTFRTKRSIAIIVAAVLLAAFGIRLPRVAAAPAMAVAVEPSILNAGSVTVHVNPDSIRSENVTYRHGGVASGVVEISGLWTTTGEPDALILEPAGLDSVIRYSGGLEIRTKRSRRTGRFSLTREATADDQPYRSIRAALAGDALVLAPRDPALGFSADIAELPVDTYTSHVSETGVLDGTTRMRVLRYVVRFAVPLKTGTSFTIPTRHGTVVEVTRSPGEASVTLRDVTVEGYTPSYSMPFYLVRNAGRRQAVFVTAQIRRQYSATLGAIGRGARVGFTRLDVSLSPAQAERIGFNDEWLKEAELVWVDTENLGIVTLPLHINEFRLRPQPTAAK